MNSAWAKPACADYSWRGVGSVHDLSELSTTIIPVVTTAAAAAVVVVVVVVVAEAAFSLV